MAASLTCNDSFHSILEVGGINGFVPFPGSVKSSFIADICYVSSCRHEFTKVTLGLNGTENRGGMGTNKSGEGPKEVKQPVLFVPWEQRVTPVHGVDVGFE